MSAYLNGIAFAVKISSTKPHEDTLSINFIFVIFRVASWMIF
jgi:hypothetical protein